MPKDWETVEVTADQLREINKSYSGDTIADSKSIRRPFKFKGSFYVSTGGVLKGDSIHREECYQIVPRQQFKGKATWYGEKLRATTGGDEDDWAAQRRAQAKGFYHGMLIKRGKAEWVLVGPPLVFQQKEGSTETKQLGLF